MLALQGNDDQGQFIRTKLKKMGVSTDFIKSSVNNIKLNITKWQHPSLVGHSMSWNNGLYGIAIDYLDFNMVIPMSIESSKQKIYMTFLIWMSSLYVCYNITCDHLFVTEVVCNTRMYCMSVQS